VTYIILNVNSRGRDKQTRTCRSILAPGPGLFGKFQGVNSMTWQTKVVRVLFVVGILGALALAVGSNFIEYGGYWFW